MSQYLLCSECFSDHGLRLDAQRIGVTEASICPNCGASAGAKLTKDLVEALSHRFFVWGTLHKCDYGAAPIVQFNSHQSTSISAPPWLEPDLRLIEKTISVGFFHYGPRLWMVGEVEPLKYLQNKRIRLAIIQQILEKYPDNFFSKGSLFYRIRKAPEIPEDLSSYDSPPRKLAGRGRLDSSDFPVMYGSQDLEVCIDECRTTAEDEIYVATLAPDSDLRLLDLTEVLPEQGVTEFESIDMAVHMLFLAGDHSYPISREIALHAHSAGNDGVVYPSYFSLLRTGAMPFETALGISHRRIDTLREREKSKIIRNFALFGRPIEENRVHVASINKVIVNRVQYGYHFGPTGA